MNKNITRGLLTVALSVGMVGAAFATPINSDGGGTNFNEPSLQQIFDYMAQGGSSTINVNNDQLVPDSYFNISSSHSGSATLLLQITGNANSFGLYQKGDTSNRLELFDDSSAHVGSPGYLANLVLNTTTHTISASSLLSGGSFLGTLALGNDNKFGFYLQLNDGGQFWYSDMTLNSDGADHMVGFRGDNSSIDIDCAAQIVPYPPSGPCSGDNYAQFDPGEIIFGWEDGVAGNDGLPGDWDYQDFVVETESINPVPEPGVLGMFGLGLLGLGFALRRRQSKR